MFKKQLSYPAEMHNITEYFDSRDIELSENFDLSIFAESIEKSVNTASIILCNIEDDTLLKQIALGNYEDFDIYDEFKFNDDYQQMCEFLNI